MRSCALALSIAVDIGADTLEFEGQFPESAGKPERMRNQVQAVRTAMHNESVAKTAATLLRQLGGYAGGVIEVIALDQKITADQIEAARARRHDRRSAFARRDTVRDTNLSESQVISANWEPWICWGCAQSGELPSFRIPLAVFIPVCRGFWSATGSI